MPAVSTSELAVSDGDETLPAPSRHLKARQQLVSEMALCSSEKRRRVTSPQLCLTSRGEDAFLSETRMMVDESISAAVARLWAKIEKKLPLLSTEKTCLNKKFSNVTSS